MHFGTTLRLLRTSSGVSLSALATQVGVSSAYLSRVEHGHDAPPTADRLRSIGVALGLAPDRLVDLVEELRPDAIAWLDRAPEGRQLAAELRRRDLGPAQIARVIQFVRREFPLPSAPTDLGLDPARVLLGVRAAAVRDVLEIAALRLGGRELARELGAHERSGAVGGGLLVAHGAGTELRACVIVLATPLEIPTPDARPIRVVLVLVGPVESRTAVLVEASRLADARLVDALTTVSGAEELIARTRAWLGRS